MPLDDLAGEAVGGIFRFIGRIIVEIFFEVLLQGSGRLVIRAVRPDAEPTDGTCTAVGLLLWLSIAAGGFWLYRSMAAT